jgi:uncharacterized repeat protein (TIGR01451 family)
VTDDDTGVSTDSQTVLVNNVAPVPKEDVETTNEDAPVTFNVLDNDTDASALDVLTAVPASFITARGGLVTISANGTATYDPDGRFESLRAATTDSFSYTVEDDDGATAVGNVTVSVTPVNDAPANVLPVPQATHTNTPLVLSTADGNAISVSDIDAGDAAVQVSLTVVNGTLTLDEGGGLTFSAGDGNDDPQTTFTGMITDINAALDGMTYMPNRGFTGVDTISITTNDLGNTGAGGPLDDTDSLTIAVGSAANADLAVTMSDSPDPVVVGNQLTYTVVVTNLGPLDSTGVVLTDSLPAGVSFVSVTTSQGSGAEADGVVTADLGSLVVGASAEIAVVVTPNRAQEITNSVSVAGNEDDGDGDNNRASAVTVVIPAVADLSVTVLDSPSPVLQGHELTYSIAVTNNGPVDATGVVATDRLPVNASFISATSSHGTVSETDGVVTADVGGLASGVTAEITIILIPDRPGEIENRVIVTGNETDTDHTNNEASVTTTVQAVNADLLVTMIDSPDPAIVGSPLTYSITVTNNGPMDAGGVTLTDTLPASVTLISVAPGELMSSLLDSTVTVDLGNLASEDTVEVTIVVSPNATGKITNTAEVSGKVTDPARGNNRSRVRTDVGTPLLLHDVESVPPASTATTLKMPTLALAVAESAARWQATDMEQDRISILHKTELCIADLPGSCLGLAALDAIWIDHDAAGRGWFIDTTATVSPHIPSGQVDLLSVVTHEGGHVLGFGHTRGNGVMDALLAPAQRPSITSELSSGGWNADHVSAVSDSDPAVLDAVLAEWGFEPGGGQLISGLSNAPLRSPLRAIVSEEDLNALAAGSMYLWGLFGREDEDDRDDEIADQKDKESVDLLFSL